MHKRIQQLLTAILLFWVSALFSQNNISIGNNAPDSSARLDIQSTTQGLLIPRLTSAQRNAMPKKTLGLLVFDTDKHTVMMYNGSSWSALLFGDPSTLPPAYSEPPTQFFGQGYGCSVSISGNWAAVGAFGHHDQYENGEFGAVFMYQKVNGNWTFRQLLKASDRAAGDRFGYSVSVSGTALIVGASLADLPAKADAGKGYAFRYNGSSWIEEKVMTASDAAAEDYFGTSVALDGNLAIIGAPGKEYVNQPPTRNNEGAVYIWRYASFVPDWVQDYSDIWDQGIGNSKYGSSVSIDSATGIAAIGAPGHYNNKGVVAIKYKQSNPEWALTFFTNSISTGGQYGSSVSLKGNYLAVGSPYENGIGSIAGSGRVYVYKLEFGSWNYHGDVAVTDAQGGDMIGAGVSLQDPYLVVGMPGKNVNGFASQGQALVFKLGTVQGPFGSTPGWIRQRSITDGTSTANNNFATSVFVNAGNVCVGGYFYNQGNGKVAFINVE